MTTTNNNIKTLNRVLRFKINHHKVTFDPSTNKGNIITPDGLDVSFILVDHNEILPISEIDNSIKVKIGKHLNDIFEDEDYPDYFSIDLSKFQYFSDKAIIYAGYANGLVYKFEVDANGNISMFKKIINDDSVWIKIKHDYYWNGYMICYKNSGFKVEGTLFHDLNKIMPEVMIRLYSALKSVIQENIKKGFYKFQ